MIGYAPCIADWLNSGTPSCTRRPLKAVGRQTRVTLRVCNCSGRHQATQASKGGAGGNLCQEMTINGGCAGAGAPEGGWYVVGDVEVGQVSGLVRLERIGR